MSDKIFDDAFNLLCGDKIAKWLAPCEYMSPDGRILLQRKVTPCEPEELECMPKALPAFLTDTKFKNFGWLDGRVVCIDYAGTIPNPSLKMVKAEWW